MAAEKEDLTYAVCFRSAHRLTVMWLHVALASLIKKVSLRLKTPHCEYLTSAAVL